jgi:general secretion pathway protein G
MADLNDIIRRRRREAGFTLVEALIVLAIIGLIMQLVGPRVMTYWAEAKVKSAGVQAERLASALELFYLDAGRYPSAAEGLRALVEPPSRVERWNGPYIKGNSIPLDPWGQPYIYRVSGPNGPFEVSFRQPDGKDSGERRRQASSPTQ